MLTVVDAVTRCRVCVCRCFHTLPATERARGIRAVYMLDDALRGWRFTPHYDIHGDALWRAAQARNDPNYRGIAVRFGECIHRRLLGSLIHENLHAAFGDVTRANYGIPFGVPYAVPESVAERDEASFLEPFNVAEARAWVGVWIVAKRMFGLDWDLRTARDVGTYGFTGGNALIPARTGFRAVAHVDRQHHPERYAARARVLQDRAREWFASEANLDAVVQTLREAANRGEATRSRRYPDADTVAAQAPKPCKPNEPCVCGSGRKLNDCCANPYGNAVYEPQNAR